MRDWLPLKEKYLEAMYAYEAPRDSHGRPIKDPRDKSTKSCQHCRSARGDWRCTSCFRAPLLCSECCVKLHKQAPFHRIERWMEDGHFEAAQLADVGLRIFLGTAGEACVCHGRSNQEGDRTEADEDEWESDEEEDDGMPNETYLGRASYNRGVTGNKMIVVHVTGVHVLPVLFCSCSRSLPPDIQLLAAGLYPSTQRAIRTCFTFEVLDAYLLDNLECKTPASSFFARLRRLTNPIQPHKVPVSATIFNGGPCLTRREQNHYEALLRVSRQWSHLRDLMKHGFGYPGAEVPGRGDLAYFCPACPQPGINLPSDWKEDPEQYVLITFEEGPA